MEWSTRCRLVSARVATKMEKAALPHIHSISLLIPGPYARPISHLAATLNLPPGLVALRHRATHEDLPPLPHLHRALLDSLEYLHTYSFLPLLNHGAEEGWGRRVRAEGLVARWKKIMKERVRTRDVTVESESGRAVKRLRREFEGENTDEVVEAIVRTGLVPVARK